MKHFLFTLFIGFLYNGVHAQITGPDTVEVNTLAQFSTTYEAPFYTWSPDVVNVDQTINPELYDVVVSSGMNTTCFTTINYDNGNYYSFLISYSNNSVYKLSYGNSPLNTPAFTDMGTFGLNTNQTDGIDIAKDSATGNWYAFITGGTQFLRLNFGASLSNNTPTATMMSYPAYLQWPHQTFLKRDAGQWMLFVANRSGGLSRFDFGNSLSNTPTGTSLPIIAGIDQPVGFFMHKQGGNWYMVVLNLMSATLTRLNFGTDLQNNNPTGINLGNPGSYLTLPRGSSLIAGCDDLLGYILIQDGSLIKLDFQNDITNNSPVATVVGTTSAGGSNNLISFVYNDSLYWLRTNTNTFLYRTKVMTYPSGSSSGFGNNTWSHTYTQTGTYDLTLHCGQGAVQGPASFCKQVVVVDSILSAGTTKNQIGLTLYPNPNNGSFSIKGSIHSQYAKANVQLTDILGRVILSEEIMIANSKIEKTIVANDLVPGNYILKISTPDYNQVLQVTKN